MQNCVPIHLGGILTRLGPPGAQTPFCIILRLWPKPFSIMQNGVPVHWGGILTRLAPPGAQTPFCIILKALAQTFDYKAERCSGTFGRDSDSSGPTCRTVFRAKVGAQTSQDAPPISAGNLGLRGPWLSASFAVAVAACRVRTLTALPQGLPLSQAYRVAASYNNKHSWGDGSGVPIGPGWPNWARSSASGQEKQACLSSPPGSSRKGFPWIPIDYVRF